MNTNPTTNLIRLIEQDLGPGRRSGRLTKFHCPFPDHKRGDKNPSLVAFSGTDERGAWWKCYACGRHGGMRAWLMEYRGMSYADMVDVLRFPLSQGTTGRTLEIPIQEPYPPPDKVWQARAQILIKRAEDVLWSTQGKDARDWLRARGLKDDTIRAARLGYIPVEVRDAARLWGNPRDDQRPIYIPPQSILIPGLISQKVWYLKYRWMPAQNKNDRYKSVRGSQTASLYLADHIADDQPVVFCEGEFDALLLEQEIQDLASVVTLGAATNDLNLVTWGLYLLRPTSFILAYDADKAGNKADGKLAWLHNSQRLKIPELHPGDKDLTDFHKSGGNLYSLIENVLRPDAPIFVHWPAGTKPATIRGQYWCNPDHRIEAFYTPEQLDLCLDIMSAREEGEQVLI